MSYHRNQHSVNRTPDVHPALRIGFLIMALVEYSGSEESDVEKPGEKPVGKRPANTKADAGKSSFPKVVDRSQPHKIRVALPEAQKIPSEGTDENERPAKRTKLGSGGFSGFNSLLPAPKRAATTNGDPSSGRARRGGLGSGVNLKTGATPGFSREPEPEAQPDQEVSVDHFEAQTGEPASEAASSIGGNLKESSQTKEIATEMPKLKGKSTMFKPLSVARKPMKKVTPTGNLKGNTSTGARPDQPKELAPRQSLFPNHEVSANKNDCVNSREPYQPMIYGDTDTEPTTLNESAGTENELLNASMVSGAAPPSEDKPQTLDAIASDLNLSASAKRQLLGRKNNHTPAIGIVNFSIDEEYKSNEALRQSGEQIQHNPVRAIAPGKHSLKQLVNMGTSQADALEESFASGRRNRSEAGSKYGW